MIRREYPVELIVTNVFGCTDTARNIVRIDGVFSAYVPNAFTPNADGSNDVFLPVVRDDAGRDYDHAFSIVGEQRCSIATSPTSVGTGA